MTPVSFLKWTVRAALIGVTILGGNVAAAGPEHGIAMYGEPALPPDFVSVPYANPDAPKGGEITLGGSGGFDSLNPFVRKGTVPWQLRFFTHESLMGRSQDEPFTLYGLLAESVEVPEGREWVRFTLRPEARFSDGSPVTVEDVIWSFETLGTDGHPRYHGLWSQIDRIEATGDRSVTIHFNTDNRELALIAGLRPILQKAQWEGRDFADAPLDAIPLGTGPYVVTDYDAGRFVQLTRNPDYWGADLPFMAGQANLDEIRLEFFGDGQAMFEAVKGGLINSHRESNAEKWETQYDFPAVRNGELVKSEIPHERPSGMIGFVMNSRKAAFSDWRVRAAMLHAFNFEYINDAMTGGRQERITSYFSNSFLGMEPGPATGRVAEMLAPYEAELLPGALEGYELPVSDGSVRNRANLRRAMGLMEEAGFTIEDGAMVGPNGAPFTFEVLLAQGSAEAQSIMDLFAQALERMGISVTITVIDPAQYTERTNNYDFDMAYYQRGLSLSPGNEQKLYFGAAAADQPGSRNWMGVKSPAVDGLIDTMLNAENREDFIAATRALDRVLTTGRYVIPIYQWNISRIAHAQELKFPEELPIYGDWLGWQPDVWWWDE